MQNFQVQIEKFKYYTSMSTSPSTEDWAT